MKNLTAQWAFESMRRFLDQLEDLPPDVQLKIFRAYVRRMAELDYTDERIEGVPV